MSCRYQFLLLLLTLAVAGCDHSPRVGNAAAAVDAPVKSTVFAFEKGAMTAEEFSFLRSIVLKAVTELKPPEQFSVIAYDEKVYAVWEGVKTANADNKKFARDWLLSLELKSPVPESLLALKEAAKLKPTNIYFICNPACFAGYAKLPSIAEELKPTTSVHVIAFNGQDAEVENALRELAKTTRGDLRFLDISPLEDVKVFGSERS